MTYFSSRDIAAIALCAALWAVLNTLITPIFWQMTHMPFLCDLLAFVSLILVTLWTRKLGSASITGLIVTALTLILRPGAFHMLGFIVASIVFDILTKIVGYTNCFDKPLRGALTMLLFSIICAGLAGGIIGSFFMDFKALPAILTFAGLHAIGGVIGIILVRALTARKILPTC